MSNSPARPWRLAEFVVHYVYMGTMFLNGGLFLFLPPSAHLPYERYRAIFLGLVGLTLATVPLVFLLYRRYVSVSALEHIRRATGEGRASSTFKLGIIFITCLGDFSGVAGASLFTFTRDPRSLVLFLLTWTLQYGLTAFWLSRGKKYFQQLTDSALTLGVESVPLRPTGS